MPPLPPSTAFARICAWVLWAMLWPPLFVYLWVGYGTPHPLGESAVGAMTLRLAVVGVVAGAISLGLVFGVRVLAKRGPLYPEGVRAVLWVGVHLLAWAFAMALSIWGLTLTMMGATVHQSIGFYLAHSILMLIEIPLLPRRGGRGSENLQAEVK